MIRVYVRSAITTYADIIGNKFDKATGPVRGVIIAEQVGDNVFVGYSILHKNDMSDRQKTHGMNKAERIQAIEKARMNPVKNVNDLSGLHTMIQKMLPDFLKRCGSCFLNAKTINDSDITPFKRSYKDRMDACHNIAININKIAAGLIKLADEMEAHSLSDCKDINFVIEPTNAVVSLIGQLADKVMLDDIRTILMSYSGRELNMAMSKTESVVNQKMINTFGDIAVLDS